ncbi:MAG: aminotransferase class I/II-fold pyridoxal phosphate-dependent enzyme [Chloroflexi bacterium]|nr:aminotransferase class I/II-fold pyridoxal phosphate-dependent enzyme [Dehalococcoidia bacterium]MCO5201274.1 aminotransferase class I/II-fold pyridoxal phosphate-dependent enzyme [Chloroflexota bacterium]NJD66095.1 aminotransferase class I/II-fold pyridoxal phosphate-dependent enzyme [Chloroflexota bacterium]PWB45449.1 MAG: aromatic amino acid aminotransferase [Dehalococcoidia bacterium]
MLTETSADPSRFISRRMQAVPPSGIRKFFDLLSTIDDVISLGVGEPDYVTPEPIRRAAIESIEHGHTHYTSNYGLLELREKLSDHIFRLYGVRYDPKTEIVITSGSSEAFDVALRSLLDSGDEVLCADPCYVAYMPATVMAGGTFAPVPTYGSNDFRLLAADVEAAVTPRTKALLLGYPSNPTGATMGREDLLAIAEVAERHDLAVISDELYDRMTYVGEHTCFASLPRMRDRTVLLGGFSKAYAMTGWRLGWVAAPGPLAEAVMKVHQYVMMSAPTASQYAAVAALDEGESFVAEMVAEYDRRRRLIVDGLRAVGLSTFEPRGAFYAFPDITVTGMDSVTFSERLLAEERVAVVPGSAFGAYGEGYVRACYASGYEQIERALERIGRFVQRHRSG